MPTWLKARFMVLKNTRSPGLRSCLSIAWVAAACSFARRGKHQADGLFVHGLDEAAAIETRAGRVAAAAVGHAQEAHGGDYELGRGVGDTVPNLPEPVDQALVGQEALHRRRPLRRRRRRLGTQGAGVGRRH
jgi:hypothetical protein